MLNAQHTFSIIAVDVDTKEVGSAGATCLGGPSNLDGAYVISYILPGVGAIHTQSFWNPQNQENASERMRLGDNPQEIINWLTENDVSNLITYRQYGAIDISANGTSRTAAFTGNDCFNYKGERIGENYVIVGNILRGPTILDSMEARFLRSEGLPLARRLMEAMQGANVEGADVRCFNEGVSSQSAFLRVAKADDTEEDLSIDISISQTPFGVEPIDQLQEAFNVLLSDKTLEFKKLKGRVFPNPVQDYFDVRGLEGVYEYTLYNVTGKIIDQGRLSGQKRFFVEDLPGGTYIFTANDKTNFIQEKIIIQR